ncbi:hypothetical protein [Streptomyces sp. NPDC091027]|uniref:InlB B-repeat-containing protein n=1 Tax=Streptomyces sp. NPDC091027 TaxID=3365971 RepID=UPI00380D5306
MTRACNVVNTYSNPAYSWGNQPLGDAENNNAARALQSADVLAAYRPSLVTNRRALTFAADPVVGGTLKVSQFGPYDPGAQVTVWATTNPGYRFDAWAVDGVELPNTLPPSHQLTMNTDHTITAFFIRLPWTAPPMNAGGAKAPPAPPTPAGASHPRPSDPRPRSRGRAVSAASGVPTGG